jgi:hypothetical protein
MNLPHPGTQRYEHDGPDVNRNAQFRCRNKDFVALRPHRNGTERDPAQARFFNVIDRSEDDWNYGDSALNCRSALQEINPFN